MKCLILAAGYATRLYPITKNYSKPLLKVGSKTIIDYLIDDLEKYNKIDEYIIVTNHKFVNQFESWKKLKKINTNIIIIDDGTMFNEERLGAINDIKLAIEKLNINDDLMVLAGDNLLDFSLIDFINYFYKKNHTCIMRYYEDDLNKIKSSSELVFDDNDLVLEMNEKPKNPKSNFCSPPFYIYKHDDLKYIFEALENGCNGDAPGSFIEYLCKKNKVYAMEMTGKRFDIGTLESYNNILKKFN